jgi:hypothetical protein
MTYTVEPQYVEVEWTCVKTTTPFRSVDVYKQVTKSVTKGMEIT